MADIIKKIDRGIPVTQRTQNFTQVDANEGDVLMISSSLGHCASNLTIEADATLEVRLNVYHKVYPRRTGNDGTEGGFGDLNISSGHRYKSEEGAIITVEAGSVYSMENELSITDLELVTASGVNFNIYVS